MRLLETDHVIVIEPPDVVGQLEVYAFLPHVLAHVDGRGQQAVLMLTRHVPHVLPVYLLLGPGT